MDYVSDNLASGRTIRALTIVDTYTRECLAMIDIDPNYAVPYNGLAMLLLVNKKKYDEAVVNFRKSIERDPSYAAPYTNWGNVLTAQARIEEA